MLASQSASAQKPAMSSPPRPDHPAEAARLWASLRRAMRWMLAAMVLLVSLAWRMIAHGGGANTIRTVILGALALGLAMLLLVARMGLRFFRRSGKEKG